MQFDQARAEIIAAIHLVTSALNKEQVAAKLDQADGDVEFAELELDSLAAMEVCLEIEDKTGIEIDLGDLARYPSVVALARFMASKAPPDAQ